MEITVVWLKNISHRDLGKEGREEDEAEQENWLYLTV